MLSLKQNIPDFKETQAVRLHSLELRALGWRHSTDRIHGRVSIAWFETLPHGFRQLRLLLLPDIADIILRQTIHDSVGFTSITLNPIFEPCYNPSSKFSHDRHETPHIFPIIHGLREMHDLEIPLPGDLNSVSEHGSNMAYAFLELLLTREVLWIGEDVNVVRTPSVFHHHIQGTMVLLRTSSQRRDKSILLRQRDGSNLQRRWTTVEGMFLVPYLSKGTHIRLKGDCIIVS